MDAVTNPYAPGAGTRPPELSGRSAELTEVDVLLERLAAGRPARGIVVTGLRGVGKTVLVNEYRDRGERAGWYVAKLEAARDRDLRVLLTQAFAQVLRAPARRPGLSTRLRHAIAALRSFSLTASPDGSLTVGIDIEPATGRADTGEFETDLTDLLADLGAAAAEEHRGVLVLIDELQDCSRHELAALAGAAHESEQRNLPVAVIGAGLPSLPGILTEARSYAERLFSYRRIGALDPSAAAEALVRPAAVEGVSWKESAVEQVVEASKGYPYFVQAFAKEVWNSAPASPITRADAAAGIVVAQHELDIGFYGSRWDRATPGQRDYLRAMSAVTDDSPVATSDVARRLDRSLNALSPVRDQLIRKGLVYPPEHGLIAFTVPGMAAFIMRQPE